MAQNPFGQLGPWQNFGNSNGSMFYSPDMLKNAGFNPLSDTLWKNGNFYAQNAAQNPNNTDDTALPSQGGGITQFYQGDPNAGGTQLRILGDQATQGPFGSFNSSYDPTIGNYTTQNDFAAGVPYTGAGNSWYNQLAGYAPLLLGAGMVGGGALAGIGDTAAGTGALSAADTAAIDAANAGVYGGSGTFAGTQAAAPVVDLTTAGTTGATGGASAATAAINQALGTKFTDGDLAKLGLGGLQAGLGYLGSKQQSGTLQDIYNQQRADRGPALAAYNDALANPDKFYQSAPAQGAADAVLRKLSMQGNPANNPGSLAQAAAYNLGGYNNYLSGLAGPAFGGQATQAQLGTNIAGAQGGGLNAIGYGLGTALSSNPMDEYIKALTNQMNQGYKYAY